MKQLEKILGTSIIIIMLLGILFIIPYASAITTLLSVLLSGFYFYCSFLLLNNIRLRNAFKKTSYSELGLWRLLGTIFTGFVLSLVVIYSLFKFQRWPYGQQGLMISLVLLLFVIIVVSIKLKSTNNIFYKDLLVRLFIIGFFGALLFYTPSEQLIELKYRNYPNYIEAEKQLMLDPTNEILQKKAIEEREKIDLNN